MARALNASDSIFLQMESTDTPMHVAGLQIFQLPDDAEENFIRKLVRELREPKRLAEPWNLKFRPGPLGGHWAMDDDVDLDYHVRHIALPRPGGERELGELVSRLHGHRLRRHRPLWECYVIEGLEGRRFALYTKIHHALSDGISTMRLMTEFLSGAPDAPVPAPWAVKDPRPSGSESPKAPPASDRLNALKAQFTAVPAVARAASRMVSAVSGRTSLTLPYSAPRSVLNGRITGQRRYATQQVDMGRIKAVGKASGATLNDVVLALCGTALRRFLQEANSLPDKSLVAGVPVSERAPGDTQASNAVTMMFAGLGTHIGDPRERLDLIRSATRAGKAHLQAIPGAGQLLYKTLLHAPFVLQTVSGLASRTRPCFNLTISNVPGPSNPLYLQGARLEALYPVSIAGHGQAMNITCASYNGSLNFGICGCRDALPHLQRLAVYLGDALIELESALGLTPATDQRAARDRRTSAAA